VHNIIPLIPHQRIESAICQLSKWGKNEPSATVSKQHLRHVQYLGELSYFGSQYWEGSVAGRLKYEANAGSLNPALHDAPTFRTQSSDSKQNVLQ
jgi:hypothetical protein